MQGENKQLKPFILFQSKLEPEVNIFRKKQELAG